MDADWFSKRIVDACTTMLTEPFVHEYMRANIWHVRGRDVDLLVDTGMGICPLASHIDTPAGKPLLVVATTSILTMSARCMSFRCAPAPPRARKNSPAWATPPPMPTSFARWKAR